MLNQGLPVAIGEKTEMPDLDEPAGEYMQKEPPDKLDCIEKHFFDLIVILRVTPVEVDATVFQIQQASIGNRHSMRIAC
jgi:hypothetical protein